MTDSPRLHLRSVFFSERRPRVYFYTSNHDKYIQARTIFDMCGLPLHHFRSQQDPYDEPYDLGRVELLKSAIRQVSAVIGRRSLFFVEDTSIRIDALSDREDVPGLRAKEWFAETAFEALDRELRRAGDRGATVRSDIALHVPGIEPVIIGGATRGLVADEPPTFSANASYPWLTPTTFNGWFVPEGASRPIGAMAFDESLKFDFRARSLSLLIDRLAEYTAVLNLSPPAYERIDRVETDAGDQPDLFSESPRRRPRIVMVAGYTCAGKTEFGKVAEQLPTARHVEASSVLREIGSQSQTGLSGFDLAREILSRDGPDVVAREVVERIVPYTSEEILVVTGFRTLEEVAYVKRKHPTSSLLFLRADARTRLQRQVQRAREGSVKNMEELRARDLEQESFGLLAVGEDIADMLLDNDGTSDQSLEDYRRRVRALLQGADRVAGLTTDARPRMPLAKERLYRCLSVLRIEGAPLTAAEIASATASSGSKIEQRNVNQALKAFPQFARRRDRPGAERIYELTEAGLAYLRQREARAHVLGDSPATTNDSAGERTAEMP